MPPPTGSEVLQGPPDTGRRPLSFQDSTGPWSHNMYRAGSNESRTLRALESDFFFNFWGQRPAEAVQVSEKGGSVLVGHEP
jgi:hypothetical protein